jgi:hypothetical protein
LPWRQTSEYIFWSFRRIWTKKTSKNTFRNFCTWIKSKCLGIKKSHEERREYFLRSTTHNVWSLIISNIHTFSYDTLLE